MPTKIFLESDDVIWENIFPNVGPSGCDVTNKVEGVDRVTQEVHAWSLVKMKLIVTHYIPEKEVSGVSGPALF